MSFDIEPEHETSAPNKDEYRKYEVYMNLIIALGEYAIVNNLKTEKVDVVFKLKKEVKTIEININL